MGKLVILGGPSTSGKTTALQEIAKQYPLKQMITVTTRPPRPGEVNGKDYFFMTPDVYDYLVEQGQMPERTEYAGVKYGVLKKTLDEIKNGKDNYWAVMDAVGVRFMRNYLGEDHVRALYVGIRKDTMENRLRERGSAEDEIRRRVEQAIAKEMSPEYRAVYDAEISNDDEVPLATTVFTVKNILRDWGIIAPWYVCRRPASRGYRLEISKQPIGTVLEPAKDFTDAKEKLAACKARGLDDPMKMAAQAVVPIMDQVFGYLMRK